MLLTIRLPARVHTPQMDAQTFTLWLQIAALALGAALAMFYAAHKPDTRALSAILTIVFAGLAVYRFAQLQ